MARTRTGIKELTLLLEIFKRIPYDRKISSSELLAALNHSGFPISQRTLQRYLKSLINEDLGVSCDASTLPYGYRKDRAVVGLESMQLDSNAKLLLNLTKQHLKYQIPAEIRSSLDYLFSLSETHDSQNQSLSESWIDKVAVVSGTVPMIAPNILPRIFKSVSEGLFEGKQLDITYKRSDGTSKSVRVHPLGLVQQEVRLYLVCRYVESNELRHFALHRMEKVEVTDLASEASEDFSLKNYIREHHFNYGNGNQIELSIRFTNPKTAVNLRETPFNKTQTLKEVEPGVFLLKVTMEDSKLLDGWIEVWKKEGGFLEVNKKIVGSVSEKSPKTA